MPLYRISNFLYFCQNLVYFTTIGIQSPLCSRLQTEDTHPGAPPDMLDEILGQLFHLFVIAYGMKSVVLDESGEVKKRYIKNQFLHEIDFNFCVGGKANEKILNMLLYGLLIFFGSWAC